jgi:hypothetical protein
MNIYIFATWPFLNRYFTDLVVSENSKLNIRLSYLNLSEIKKSGNNMPCSRLVRCMSIAPCDLNFKESNPKKCSLPFEGKKHHPARILLRCQPSVTAEDALLQ